MSSIKYAAPLRLDIKPSFVLLVCLFVLHALALSIILVVELNLVVSLVLLLLVLISAYVSINLHALRKSPNAITGIVWDVYGGWYLTFRSGDTAKVSLCGDSFSHPRLTILNFKSAVDAADDNSGDQSPLETLIPTFKSVVLLKDNISKSDFRRLRVRLKIDKSAESA